MKFTSKDLAETLGFKVGYKVKLGETIFEVTNNYELENQENKKSLPLWFLVDTEKDFEIIEPRNKVKELTCDEISCEHCGVRRMGHCCSYKQFIR